MGRRLFAVLGGLMMTTGALIVVAPASLGVASAPTTLRLRWESLLREGLLREATTRPVPIRSLTAPAAGAPLRPITMA
ncbi:hypothetical protein [Actinomadura macra]|uniref:hypothetical protein n=1 Tax=Actinomadura macra TaxID=46164 RepID=UPI0008362367|nr:hypothetical protein [Actinomadura macra]